MNDIDQIKPNYLKELTKIEQPFPLLHAVFKAVLVVLNNSDEECDTSWKNICSVIQKKDFL